MGILTWILDWTLPPLIIEVQLEDVMADLRYGR